jgi:hypothetical protein
MSLKVNVQKVSAQAHKAKNTVKEETVTIQEISVQVKEAKLQLKLAEEWALKSNTQAMQSDVLAQQVAGKAQSSNLRAMQLSKELQAVYSSCSWRLTLPLRKATRIGKWLFKFAKRAFRWLFLKVLASELGNSMCRSSVIAWLKAPHGINEKWLIMAKSRHMIPPEPLPENLKVNKVLSKLSPTALRVYGKLRSDIENQKK